MVKKSVVFYKYNVSSISFHQVIRAFFKRRNILIFITEYTVQYMGRVFLQGVAGIVNNCYSGLSFTIGTTPHIKNEN